MHFNLNLPGFAARRYEHYRRFREIDPVHYAVVPGMPPGWYLFRHADVDHALRDERLVLEVFRTKDQGQIGHFPPRFEALNRELGNWFIFRDPPYHTRMRALINRAFTPRIVDGLVPRIENIAGRLLDDTVRHGNEFDLIGDFARPLPVNVIAEMLGIDPEHRPRFARQSILLAGAVGGGISPEQLMLANQACMELEEFFADLLQRRRHDPGDDLISAIATTGADQAESGELVSICILLLFAGHETTVNLIGNGMLALLQNPEQLARIKHEPELLSRAVEELLRYDAPVQMVNRYAAEDMDVDGRRIGRGERVTLVLGSANRDPLQYADPDWLDVTRKVERPLFFGGGIHFCVGAALARTEGRIALAALLDRYPDLRLLEKTPVWRRTAIFSGLTALMVGSGRG